MVLTDQPLLRRNHEHGMKIIADFASDAELLHGYQSESGENVSSEREPRVPIKGTYILSLCLDARLFAHLPGLDDVAFLDVVEGAKTDTTLVALADLGCIVLEATQ